jgi:hypothetical protein
VHVAQRDRDDPAGHAAAHELDGARVGAGRPRVALELHRDAGALRGGDEFRVNDRVDVRPPRDDRAAAELELAELPLVAIRVVCRVAHLYDDRHVGVDAVGRCSRAAHADFLLRRRHGHDLGHG